MKRFTILINFLMLAIIQMAAQDTSLKGTITLSHQGKETSFAYNEMIKVMDAAEDGDTVLFSTGYFQGDFRMTKVLTLIGSGADSNNGWNNCTCYDGNVVLNLTDGAELSSRLFDGIYFNKSITFNSAINNVIIRKCYWSNELNFNAEVDYLLADRCRCRLRIDSSNLKKLVARNSYVDGTPSSLDDPANAQFYNCNVYSSTGWCISNDCTSTYANFQGTFYNCILYNYQDYFRSPNSTDYYTVLINCLYSKKEGIDDGCSLQNCYKDDSGKYIFNFTKEELQQNGYLGTDGTVVGYYGGKNPYTLSTNGWNITSKFHLDKDSKQIQFNLNISE